MRNQRASMPNKPMVPAAPTQPDEYSLYPLRRHIGRPLGGDSSRWSQI